MVGSCYGEKSHSSCMIIVFDSKKMVQDGFWCVGAPNTVCSYVFPSDGVWPDHHGLFGFVQVLL